MLLAKIHWSFFAQNEVDDEHPQHKILPKNCLANQTGSCRLPLPSRQFHCVNFTTVTQSRATRAKLQLTQSINFCFALSMLDLFWGVVTHRMKLFFRTLPHRFCRLILLWQYAERRLETGPLMMFQKSLQVRTLNAPYRHVKSIN